jgi:AAA domain/DnaB-like helicase N terminal domain
MPRRPAHYQSGAAMTNAAKNHNTQHSDAAEQTVRWERCALGALLEVPNLWATTAITLKAEDFLLEHHRRIFGAIAKLQSQGAPTDLCSVAAVLGSTVAVGHLSSLIDGVVPENYKSYAAHVRDAHRERRFRALHEQLAEATNEDRPDLLQQMLELLQGRSADQDWRSIFHSADDFENAPPLRFAIENFLQEAGITLIGGLAGHGKTLLMLAMVRALLEAAPLFGHALFAVQQPAERVLYLIPESSIGPFKSRLQLFRMQEHIRSGRLLVRTLSSREQIKLDDARLLKAAQGADVFLDTAVRFMLGSENDVADTRPFADDLFRLLGAGARTIVGAHHSPKSFESADWMTLENLLRGSGDIGGMLCTCWGVRQVDTERNQLYIQNVKPRDFQPCLPFLLEARPHLDETGEFKMIAEPGTAGAMRSYLRKGGDDDQDRSRGGRPARADKDLKLPQAVELRARGVSIRDIAKTVDVKKSTLEGWLFHYDLSQKPPEEGVWK